MNVHHCVKFVIMEIYKNNVKDGLEFKIVGRLNIQILWDLMVGHLLVE